MVRLIVGDIEAWVMVVARVAAESGQALLFRQGGDDGLSKLVSQGPRYAELLLKSLSGWRAGETAEAKSARGRWMHEARSV